MEHAHRKQSYESHIRWCMQCNVPLIGKICDLCAKKGKAIKISQPGDAKIALEKDMRIISGLVSKMYGDHAGKIINGKIIILNRRPGLDRVEEIIIDGFIFGLLEFDLKQYSLIPSADGLSMLKDTSSKRKIIVKKTIGHIKGKYISKKDLEIKDPEIHTGDYVTVMLGNSVALGQVKDEFSDEKYLKILDISSENPKFSFKNQSAEKVINANSRELNNLEKKAKDIIKNYASATKKRKSVSFSGGKDSLVVLDLVASVLDDYDIFFINTGLEFEETVKYVKDIASKGRLKINLINSERNFFDLVDRFGPPAKDYRWCCKSCKLQPLINFIDAQYGKSGCLTFEGKRKYESFARSISKIADKNPFVPNQESVYPILNWKAIDVWLYIFAKKLKYNPLYDSGFERVGCYLCPAQLESEFSTLQEIKPNLHNKWFSYLKDWAQKNGLEKRYISYGLWRWKHHPKKMLELARNLKINLVPLVKEGDYSIDKVYGISPCYDGMISVEYILKGPIDIKRAENYLKVLGTTRYSEELGLVSVKVGNTISKIFAGGQIIAKSDTKENALKTADSIVKTIIRFEKCTLCGVCEKACPKSAIKLEKDVVVVLENCNHCGRCSESCVVYKNADKMLVSKKG